MRHRVAGRKLNRNASHRLALMRNLTIALVEHGRIITTVAKAKEARPFVEKLITLGKQGTLHARRQALARLPNQDTIKAIFDDLAPRYADRPGGYTRVVKRHERRLGDAGETAFLELLKAGETKVQKHSPAPAAPAPRVTETPAPAPAPTTPPTEAHTTVAASEPAPPTPPPAS